MCRVRVRSEGHQHSNPKPQEEGWGAEAGVLTERVRKLRPGEGWAREQWTLGMAQVTPCRVRPLPPTSCDPQNNANGSNYSVPKTLWIFC